MAIVGQALEKAAATTSSLRNTFVLHSQSQHEDHVDAASVHVQELFDECVDTKAKVTQREANIEEEGHKQEAAAEEGCHKTKAKEKGHEQTEAEEEEAEEEEAEEEEAEEEEAEAEAEADEHEALSGNPERLPSTGPQPAGTSPLGGTSSSPQGLAGGRASSSSSRNEAEEAEEAGELQLEDSGDSGDEEQKAEAEAEAHDRQAEAIAKKISKKH
jgi:hypothetical protein